MSGNPKGFAVGVGFGVDWVQNPKPQRRFLGGLCACLGWVGVVVRVVVGGLYGNPKRFVGRVVLCIVSGDSLGFRAVACFAVDYCTFRNLECAFFGVCGGAFYGYGETLIAFGCVETWRVRFAWVETSAFGFCGTLGCFREGRKLERLVLARKNLGLWRVWELGVCLLRVWKLGTLAHTKLSACIRGLVELRWLSGV